MAQQYAGRCFGLTRETSQLPGIGQPAGLAIGKREGTVDSLVRVLGDASHPPAVRAAAAKALGRLGRREALDAVTAACADTAPEVAREARIAKSRLSHIKEEE